MRKIEISHDLMIPGWGLIPKGATFKVERYNSRFVYVMLNAACELRLARKGDCKKLY